MAARFDRGVFIGGLHQGCERDFVGYTRAFPERFTEERDDRLMNSVIGKYSGEINIYIKLRVSLAHLECHLRLCYVAKACIRVINVLQRVYSSILAVPVHH